MSQLELSEAVLFRDKEGRYSSALHFDIQNKLKLINPDAVYIFNNQPLILFFDLTTDENKDKENDIHRKVWSFDNSPIAFVIKETEIKIYNALNYIKKEGRLQELALTESEITEKFSFWNIQSNNLWKWFQETYIETERTKKYKKRVNDRLFENIKSVRNALMTDKENDPEGSIPNSLILRLIFIRYLIDRKIEIGSEFISGKDVVSKRQCFSKLLQDPDKLCQLFTKLNDRFNGVLFKDIDIKLTSKQADDLSGIFRGEEPERDSIFYGSDYYFEIFDFSIIPVEVISGIYESLIDPETRDSQSAVYTPSFLVEYILNDTVDVFLQENNTSECKIFEVAVGSGIFLVQSLRRMIEKEIELNGRSDPKAFSKRIREIAQKNLYGVDINKEALKVTCFSIYIALLDYQEPKDIDKYIFPNLLDENLFEANFFNTKHPFNQVIQDANPQYILGNPPWKNGSKDKIHVEYLTENNLLDVVCDFQLAQSFLLRTKDFSLSQQPICSLVVTSKAFYNNSAIAFKNKFLTEFFLYKCLDLSCVRRLIFEDANNPAMILQYQYANEIDTLENIVLHQSLKYNIFTKNYNALTFEKVDFKKIQQKYFIKHEWMFKVALYGGTLDFNFIIQLKSNKSTLKEYLKQKNIDYGKGLEMGNPKKPFPFLEGLYLIKKENFREYYIDNSNLNKITEEETFIKAGRRLSLFKDKKIILGKRTIKESKIKIAISSENTAFTENFYGITSNNEKLLHNIFATIYSNTYLYYQYLTSANWGIYTPELNLNEYLSFPYIEPNPLQLDDISSKTKLFLEDFKAYYEKEFKSSQQPNNENLLNEINKLIYEIYGIDDYQKDLIDYVLNVSRYQFQESKQYLITDFTYIDKTHYRYRDTVLKRYAETYLQEFEDIYADENIQIEIYPLKHFIAMNFVFYKDAVNDKIIYPKDKLSIADILNRLGNLGVSQITNTTDPTKNLFIQKDIKGFEENSFYIIKPNEYKCWHRAMAWYDIAEFKDKIGKAELEYLNDSENE